MECPNCHGAGHERVYEPWEDCPDCDGTGSVWADDDERDYDWNADENVRLYDARKRAGGAAVSLDVYLEIPVASVMQGEAVERIFVRRHGATAEISRGEWDEIYPGREPVTAVMDLDPTQVYERNITHNLGRMASEAGLYEAMWRPDEQGWTHARDLIEPLRDGLAMLQSDPERFKALNPANGWGDYEGLLDFAASYLVACMKWPDAVVTVSR